MESYFPVLPGHATGREKLRRMARPSNNMNLLLILIYLFVDTIFITKYLDVNGLTIPIAGGYVIAVLLMLYIFRSNEKTKSILNASSLFNSALIILAAAGYTILMLLLGPENTTVTRNLAINEWLGSILNGRFPYGTSANPSGFPFLFLMALPFYLAGDTGFLQIFAIILFGLVIVLKDRDSGAVKSTRLMLLIFSPIVAYEVMVRSDLLSNMIICIAYICLLDHYLDRRSPAGNLLLGLLGGFLLSTRGIVLPIFVVSFMIFIRRQRLKSPLFLVSFIAGFALTILPFLIWNADLFVNFGPFAIQSSYLPAWMLITIIFFSFLAGLLVRTVQGAFGAISVLLFGAAAVAFAISLFEYGWKGTIYGDKFDVAYFAFSLPFIILGLKLERRRQAG
jgi:hypothetical protein